MDQLFNLSLVSIDSKIHIRLHLSPVNHTCIFIVPPALPCCVDNKSWLKKFKLEFCSVSMPNGNVLVPTNCGKSETNIQIDTVRDFAYVILGGGVAAGYAALEFNKKGVSHGELCIISDEPVAPYERPSLSKGYLHPEAPARLPGFHTCVGANEEKLTPNWLKTLLTATGETITYKFLIIATGARALKLEDIGINESNAENVCYLRDLADATKLVNMLRMCTGGTAIVIGVLDMSDEVECRFIGGLSWSTSDRALKCAFSKFGHLLDAKVVLDNVSGRSWGFGFVTFDEKQDMEDIVEAMNGMDLDGRNIMVDMPQPERGGGRDYDGGRDCCRGHDMHNRDYGGGRGGDKCFKCDRNRDHYSGRNWDDGGGGGGGDRYKTF
ncbi:hypothetical protein M8C21_025685 [Ambrosia artemisiifolia]|uniref:RRM domain-containing protein n=1 Tax=Ambrosia artemisiifolia TaxID=4212 RepID=A0AAD5BJT9_AMBAR|nr:hypothetical protein M8C21_025685 [Ambrosia artemisiifolia]